MRRLQLLLIAIATIVSQPAAEAQTDPCSHYWDLYMQVDMLQMEIVSLETDIESFNDMIFRLENVDYSQVPEVWRERVRLYNHSLLYGRPHGYEHRKTAAEQRLVNARWELQQLLPLLDAFEAACNAYQQSYYDYDYYGF